MCYSGGGCTCCRRRVIVMAGVAALPCVVVVVALHVDSPVKKNVGNFFFKKRKKFKCTKPRDAASRGPAIASASAAAVLR